MNINEAFPEQQPIEAKPYQAEVDPLETAIATCADPETSLDVIAEIDGKIRFMKERIKAYESQRDAALIERIKACDGKGFTIGTVRYYLGYEKQTKVRDLKECLMQLLGLLGPDDTAQCLSANAIKHGQTRKLLDASGNAEVYDTLFETTDKEVLKEGKPTKEKTLIRVDERWVK